MRVVDSWLYGDPAEAADRLRGLRKQAEILKDQERKKKRRKIKAAVKNNHRLNGI